MDRPRSRRGCGSVQPSTRRGYNRRGVEPPSGQEIGADPFQHRAVTRGPAKILPAAASCPAIRAERESGPLMAPFLDRFLESPGLRFVKPERRCDSGGHVPERRLAVLGEEKCA